MAHNTTDDRFERILTAWGTTARLGDILGGGNRNDVREVHIKGTRHAARLSPRPAAAIAWELELLMYLHRNGLRVPLPVPTPDGRLHVDGMVLFTWLDGDPPTTDDDWRQVSTYLQRLHRLTGNWPQRPGFLGVHDLMTGTTGGDIDLNLMPDDAVAHCRDAWRPVTTAPRAVIHGDPGPANIRIAAGGPGFLDWDESRLDATLLDLASLPHHLSVLPSDHLVDARRAVLAWEAANGWTVEPAYARRCLQELAGKSLSDRS